MVHEMIKARDEKRLLRLQDQLAKVNLLIVDVVKRGKLTPYRITCESQGRTRTAVSCAGRQGVARGLSRGSLEAGPSQRRLRRGGRRDLRGHRAIRRGPLARGTGAGSEGRDLRTEAGAAGPDPEKAARQVPALGHSLHPGSGSADIGLTRARADIRSGPATGAVRLQTGTERPRRGETRSQPAEHRA